MEATPRSGNGESLAELLASFFARFAAATQRWLNMRECCDVRASTWCGGWSYRPWGKAYMAGKLARESSHSRIRVKL